MADLPSIFKLCRFLIPPQVRPGIVIQLDFDPFTLVNETLAKAQFDNLNTDHMEIGLSFWQNFFLDIPPYNKNEDGAPVHRGVGLHVVFPAQYKDKGVPKITEAVVYVYNYLGRLRSSFLVGDYLFRDDLTDEDSEALAGLATMLLYCMHYLFMSYHAPYDDATVTKYTKHAKRRKFVIHDRVGDTFRYEKITVNELMNRTMRSRTVSTPSPDGPAFRKREHEVRGHYRTYKSGKRVFVRAHKRGDASLGVSTRILKITS